MTHRLALSLLVGFCLTSRAPAAHADPRVHLEVARSTDAVDCPDAAALAARVAHALGRDALDPSADDAPLRFDAMFARLDGGYVATVRRSDPGRTARTLAGKGSSCRPLAEAVVVTLALMLDELAAEPRAARVPVVLAAPEAPAMPQRPTPERLEVPPVEAEDPEEPPPHPRRKSHWYGWQTLVTDAGATSLFLWALPAAESSPALTGTLVASGVAGLALGGPIVHAAHGRWGIAFADLGLRVGAVTLGAFIGYSIAHATDSSSCPTGPSSAMVQDICVPSDGGTVEGIFFGGVLGVIAASVIDSAVLAKEPLRPRPTPRDEARAPGVRWLPTITPARSGASVGVVAQF